jgi:hypothetical protein
MTTPVDGGRVPEQRNRSLLSRSFVPLALITLGVVFLLGNVIQGPGRGGLVLLGLGIAFAVGRVTTGRYGYAVPAGILLGIGCYVSLQEMVGTQPLQNSGWFFVLLGLGFVATYLIGMRPSAVWPLFPATVLIVLGLILFGWTSAAPIASFAWIASYWPAVLVLVGLWLLFRDHLPVAVRQPVATFGGIVLLAYGLLAGMATVAAAGTFARPNFTFNFGSAPYTDTVALAQPISAGETFNVTNTSGRTTVRVGGAGNVQVNATRHFSVQGQPPDVLLTPGASSVSLEMPEPRSAFGQSNWVDYDIQVPAGVLVNARTSSGALDVSGVQSPVQVESSSGSITLNDIGGDLTARSNSGRIRGTQVRHVRSVTSSSGSVVLDGDFTESAQVQTSSGGVEIKFSPASAVHVDAQSNSGSIRQRGVSLANQGGDSRHSVTGTIGNPAAGAVLKIVTNSGSVTLSN